MSRAYRISVRGSIERIVHVEDGVCSSLELLPILPKERMRDLLASELARRGFEIDGNLAKKKPEPDVTIEIDLEKSTVTVRLEADVELDIKRERHHVGDRDLKGPRDQAIRERLKDAVDADLAKVADEEVERERRRVTAKLEGKLRDLKGELDDAINRVTGAALKEKARSMGEIEEITEDAATGALTIKVKL